MHIHCVSSLTDDDEEVLAPAIVALLASFLDQLAVTYVIQAKTVDAKVCVCTRPPAPCPHWEGDALPDDLKALNLSSQLPS
jgi:hypothetical protein